MLSALTIFVSAFLLFLVQPLIAKQILPWFGGSAAVWTVCLVFFQLLLLAGYTYAHVLSRWAMRRQAVVHTLLVVLACAMLPIIADVGWKPLGDTDPTQRILLVLAATIGLPYFVVCTSGPLVQSWFSRVHAGDPRQARVYRLFALSNLASLAALVAYPFVVEPYASLRVQALGWSAGFGLFAVLVIALAWRNARHVVQPLVASQGSSDQSDDPSTATDHAGQLPSAASHLWWLLLAALGTVMLLSITTHITQNVASVPFLWIIPLALYLLTFILCFDSNFWYRRALFWPAVLVLSPAMAWAMGIKLDVLTIYQAVPLFAVGLFAICMLCHGELVRAKPAPVHLTRFYLMVSLGGAIGGLLVGVVAPRVFSGYFELPLALCAACLVVCYLARDLVNHRLVLFASVVLALWGVLACAVWDMPVAALPLLVLPLGGLLALLLTLRTRSLRFAGGLVVVMAASVCAYYSWSFAFSKQSTTVLATRNFYGELRVRNVLSTPPTRTLAHGVVLHGTEVLTPELSREAVSYYGTHSGVGLAVLKTGAPGQRIGVIGLGVGTMAAYGTPGGTVRFYEINPEVPVIARQQFDYLKNSAATVETVLGDARLVLEREAQSGQLQKFDVLLVDAFSGDSIPVHLITRQALAVYQRHMKPGGIIAFHVSNRYLNLPPVVAQLAQNAGMQAVQILDQPATKDFWFSKSSYVLVTNNQTFLDDADVRARATPIQSVPGLPLWTDDYNNLFKILIR